MACLVPRLQISAYAQIFACLSPCVSHANLVRVCLIAHLTNWLTTCATSRTLIRLCARCPSSVCTCCVQLGHAHMCFHWFVCAHLHAHNLLCMLGPCLYHASSIGHQINPCPCPRHGCLFTHVRLHMGESSRLRGSTYCYL